MLEILLNLPEGSAWLLGFKALLTLWDTTVAVLSGNHSLFTGPLLNLSRSLSLFILPRYTAWEYKNQRSGAICQQYVIYNSKVLFTRVVECDLNM